MLVQKGMKSFNGWGVMTIAKTRLGIYNERIQSA